MRLGCELPALATSVIGCSAFEDLGGIEVDGQMGFN
jgi:hypothetical protein